MGTFTDLQIMIDSADSEEIILENDYLMRQGERSRFIVKQGISITKDTYINGNGHTISANNIQRVFFIMPNVKLTLENVIIKDGNPFNGGSTITNGGAILLTRNSHLTLKNCTLYNNKGFSGGGIYLIDKTAKADIFDCTFIDNTADYYGGAIGSVEKDCVNVVNCYFEGNNASLRGGALYKVNADKCIFNENSATVGGGFFDGTVKNSVFNNNAASQIGSSVCGDMYVISNAFNCTFNNILKEPNENDIWRCNTVDCTFKYVYKDEVNCDTDNQDN